MLHIIPVHLPGLRTLSHETHDDRTRRGRASRRRDSHSAQARCHGCGVAAGVVGGLAAGAIIGSAIANSGPRYVEPAPLTAPPPAYYAPNMPIGPVCHTERQRFWDGYGWRHRRIEVCD